MREVARIDCRDRQYDEDIDCIELEVDNRSISDVATQSQIALYEGWQVSQCLSLVNLFDWQASHLDTMFSMCMNVPFVRCGSFGEKAKR